MNKQRIDTLSNIQKVDVPPFLITRIQSKIDALEQNTVKPIWAWSLVASCFLLILFNFSLINKNTTDTASELSNSLQLQTDNNLYK